ncbi:zinc-binding alcohol dehydrogenase family protein [Streptacidiphilus fuscans]|uniref:Zinc-binding alcohol dehydrogenase family protein n=1 Tax=Streptacidiphilus fuscans TaxID=2789292 RepID=A0A931FHV8_9ACTN|nr:zinc-binding alcohol dehydrogenase family protein [Streptacidiphilus fuscans]MBF9072725.1 zinc-binding alcohol dehydrogenase family protein [Streptacidiphilus fuscans]
MPTNAAAWIKAANTQLEVGPAPYTPPAADQIVVRNRAVAVNPLEWIIQAAGSLTYRWLSYPTVLGSDVAGEVVEIGSEVTRFRVGDRVLAHAVGTDKDCNKAAEGGFQLYTAVLERMAAPIPDTLAYEEAAVLPLAVSTAACGLFQDDQLGLRHPSARPEPTGQTLLVWGGSTSVGSQAIQLGVAAGYEVVTTASPRNFDYVRSLGAAEVFDYNSPDVVADIVAAFEGRTLAGAIAFGTTSAASCIRIVGACRGKRFVSLATPPVSFAHLAEPDRGRLALARVVARLVTSNVALQLAALRRGVRTKYIFGTTLKANEVGTLIYRDFLPAALAESRYRTVPEPTVAGHGLSDIQHALDLQRKGVSAAKVVVTLP